MSGNCALFGVTQVCIGCDLHNPSQGFAWGLTLVSVLQFVCIMWLHHYCRILAVPTLCHVQVYSGRNRGQNLENFALEI